jgi:AIPR protein
MNDFQIVNGCQTSNVLYDNRSVINDSVRIPVRIISTTNDAVTESVITATNRQTEVKQEQFFALKEFSKKLELFFRSFEVSKRLYYERRTHQYDSSNIEKTRIIIHKDLVRAVGAMFIQEPHRTTRSYKNLAAHVGRDMFLTTDKLEPYYVAGFALYKLNSAFNSGKLPTSLKIARYQILLTARFLIDASPLPKMNANEMEKRCAVMMDRLWNDSDKLLQDAAQKFQQIAGKMERDHIHTQGVTDLILVAFGHKKGAPT